MKTSQEINLKRTFLYTLIASIAVSALFGIWVILVGNFGWLESRILGTTLTVVGTSVLGLACGAFLESPKSRSSTLRIVPILGIILSLLSACVGLWLIWFDSSVFSESKNLYKTLSVSFIFAFSLAHLSLLSLAKLSRKFNWALPLAYVSILALASIISTLIIFEPQSDDTFVMRIIGVLAVISAAITVMIPIFHRLSYADFPENRNSSVEKIDAEIEQLKQKISDLEKEKWEILNVENEPKK